MFQITLVIIRNHISASDVEEDGEIDPTEPDDDDDDHIAYPFGKPDGPREKKVMHKDIFNNPWVLLGRESFAKRKIWLQSVQNRRGGVSKRVM